MPSSVIPALLDHLVVGVPDLDHALHAFEQATAVAPEPGGVHPDHGTRNALVGLGGDAYVEFIAIDPTLPGHFSSRRIFDLHQITAPTVVAWAVHPADAASAADRARATGVDLGELSAGQRRTPAGGLLHWRLTPPLHSQLGAVVPFLIDWGATPSPAATVNARTTLSEFSVTHPRSEEANQALLSVGSDPIVRPGRPHLSATFHGPRGMWTVR